MTDTYQFEESWRCDNCNYLMYNVEASMVVKDRLYPSPGSPPHHYLNKRFPKVCTLCSELHDVLKDSPYWMKLHTEWEEAHA
jgi:hypothetical protein